MTDPSKPSTRPDSPTDPSSPKSAAAPTPVEAGFGPGGEAPPPAATEPAEVALGGALPSSLGGPGGQFAQIDVDDPEADEIEVVYAEGGPRPPPRPPPVLAAARLPVPASPPAGEPGVQLSEVGLEAVAAARDAASRFLTPERRRRLAFLGCLGLQLTLALALVVQLVVPSLLPSLTETWFVRSAQGTPFGALPWTSYLLAAVPWLLYGAMHAADVAFLRGLGQGLAYRPLAAFLDAALPVANVPGTFALFSQSTIAVERASGRSPGGSRIRVLASAAIGASLLELIVRLVRMGAPGGGRGEAGLILVSLLALAAQLALLLSFHRGYRALAQRPALGQRAVASDSAGRFLRLRQLLRALSGATALAAFAFLAYRALGLCPSGASVASVAIEQGDQQTSFTCTDAQGLRHGRRLVVGAQGKALLEDHFSAGKLEGPHAAWFASGALQEQGDYRHDARQGDWVFYDEAGRRLRQEPYSNGALHGTAVLESEAGREEVGYQSGKRHGLTKKYDPSGKLLRWEIWTNDRQEAAGAAEAQIPEGGAALPPVEKQPKVVAVPPDMLFGGYPVDWWRNRLATLKARKDDKGRSLYALTLARLESNGLKLVEAEGAVQLVPSEAVLKRCAARGGP